VSGVLTADGVAQLRDTLARLARQQILLNGERARPACETHRLGDEPARLVPE